MLGKRGGPKRKAPQDLSPKGTVPPVCGLGVVKKRGQFRFPLKRALFTGGIPPTPLPNFAKER